MKDEIEVDLSDVRKRFSELTNEVKYGDKRVVVMRFGTPGVAFISLEDLSILEAIDAQAGKPEQK